MALQDSGPIAFPPMFFNDRIGRGSTTFSDTLIDAPGEKWGCVFRCPKTGTLGKVGIKFDAVTAAEDFRISFQDVDLTNGNPDDTDDQFRDIPSASISAGTWVKTGLITSDGTDVGAKRSVTKGDLLAIVGTFPATVGSLEIRSFDIASPILVTNDTYVLFHNATSWAKDASVKLVSVALEYDDGSYAFIGNTWPFTGEEIGLFNNTDTPDEKALRFQVPFKCRAWGCWIPVEVDGATDIVLYDSAGAVKATISLNPDVRLNSSQVAYFLPFATPVTLDINSTYRLAIKPTSTTDIRAMSVIVDEVAIMDQLSGGQSVYYSERTNGGAWTDTTTKRMLAGIILDQLDDGVGGGGGGVGKLAGLGGGLAG